jgi:hypothetical protein
VLGSKALPMAFLIVSIVDVVVNFCEDWKLVILGKN